MEAQQQKSISLDKSIQTSFWESLQLTIDIDQSKDISGVIKNLKKCGVNIVEIMGLFKTDYYMNKFLQITQTELQDDLYQDTKLYQQEKKIKKSNKLNITKVQKQTKQQCKMSFLVFDALQLEIFVQKYYEKIKNLENQYKYKIYQRGKYLQVYYSKKQDKLSVMFTNQIMNLKNQLKIYYCRDQNFIQKLKYSPFYRKLLQKQKVQMKLRYYRNQTLAILYSVDHDIKQIKDIIQKKMLYHVTFIHLKNRFLHMTTNEIIFKLVHQSLKKTIQTINQDLQFKNQEKKLLQVWIQPNFQQLCYAVHDQDQAFSVKPVEQLLKSLKNLFIFSLQMNNSRSLFNHLNKIKENFGFVKFAFKRKKTTFVFNIPQIESNQILLAFLNEIIKFIIQPPLVKIYPRNFNYDKVQIQRIVQLAQAKYLNIQNFQNVMTKDKISQIILNFKITQIQNIKNQIGQFLYYCLLKREVSSSSYKLFQCSYSKIVPKQASYSEATTNEYFQNNEIKNNISIKFEMPEIDQTQKEFFQIGKLCKNIRKQLEIQLKEITQKQIQLKVYEITLKNTIQKSQIGQSSLICQRRSSEEGFTQQNVQIKQIKDLKKGQEYYMIFAQNKNASDQTKGSKKKQKFTYIPRYMIKII